MSKKIYRSIKNEESTKADSTVINSNEEFIDLIDDFGRPTQISKKDWRDKVLPEIIKKDWDNPNTLYTIILNALSHGIIEEVEEAAKHLVDIDVDIERCICLYGIILMNLNKYQEAENSYLHYLEKHPKTGVVLTNLAKAQLKLDKQMLAMGTLEEGLKLDPNQDNGLNWWVALYREDLIKNGLDENHARIASLTEANNRFGGWRANLWLGFYYLDKKQIDEAIQLFEKMFESDWTPDILAVIAESLRNNGFTNSIITLLAKRYIPEEHEFIVGLYLLQAYIESSHVNEGKNLLDSLFGLHRLDMEKNLLHYESEFDILENNQKIISNDNVEVKLHEIDSPLWSYGWGDEKTGFENAPSGKKIALLQFSWKPDSFADQSNTEHAVKPGRLTRAIPLFLFEDMHYGSDSAPSFLFPISQNEFILFDEPLDISHIMKLDQKKFSGALTGEMTNTQIALTYWDLAKGSNQSHTFPFDLSAPEKVIPLIETFFFNAAGIKFTSDFNHSGNGFQKIINEESLRYYFNSLDQQLAIQIAFTYDGFANNLHGEHNMIRWFLDDAVYITILQTQLTLLSVIQKCIYYKSRAIKDYEPQIAAWLNQQIELQSPIHTLAQKVLLNLRNFKIMP